MEIPDKEYFDFRFSSIEIRLTQLEADNRILRESRALLQGKSDKGAFYIATVIAVSALIISLLKVFV